MRITNHCILCLGLLLICWGCDSGGEAGDTDEVPAFPAPTLIFPVDGTSGIPVPFIAKWESVIGAQGYQVQYSSSEDFANPEVLDVGVQAEVIMPNLASSTTYSWRVRACAAPGRCATSWSLASRFTLAEEGALPWAPILVTPTDSTTNQPISPIDFSWRQGAGAQEYQLQVSTVSNFQFISHDFPGLGTRLLLSGNSISRNTEYFWRVRGLNDAGAGPWAEAWQFVTAP